MNNRRELEVLEVEIDQARLSQECKSSQARMRAERLSRHQGIVKEMLAGETPEIIDSETLEIIIGNIRKKIKELDI